MRHHLQQIFNFLRQHLIFILIFLLAAGLIFFRLCYADMTGDDSIFSTRAVGLVDFMFGDRQSTPLVWFNSYPWWAYLSYHDHPPLILFIQHLFLLIKQNYFFAKLPFALMGLGTLIITYLWSKKLFNETAANFIALTLALNNLFIWSARLSYLEGGVLFFCTLTLYLFTLFVNNPKKWRLLGLFLGLSLLTKYSAFFLAPAILFYLLFYGRNIFREKRFYFALLLALLIFSPIIVYNVMMFRTTGHFDLTFSGLFHQSTPLTDWQLEVGLKANPLPRAQNIFFDLAQALSWPYLIFALLGALVLLLSAAAPLPLIAFIVLFAFYSLIGASTRHLPLFASLAAVFAGYFFYSWFRLIKNNIRDRYFAFLALLPVILIYSYFLFFILNNHFLLRPVKELPGIFSSTVVTQNYGLYQLDAYLNELTADYYVINRIDHTIDLKKKEPRLMKYALTKNTNSGNQPIFYEVFVFDGNLNWFAKLWLFERRIFYNNYLFFTDATLVESNKDRENIGQFYFIKTGPGAHLDAARYQRNTSAVLENEFLARHIKPVKEIYRLDGQLAFKIYHYLPGTFAE